jgi:toxin FitB
MIILDTNLISELMKPTPDYVVDAWFNALYPIDVAFSTVTLFEIRYGINLLPASAKRQSLEDTLRRIQNEKAFGRILHFGPTTANCAAEIFAQRRKMGRPVPIPDCLIAGHVLEHQAVLATRNVRDFDGVGLSLINPWETAS